jgi:hypothetical protein
VLQYFRDVHFIPGQCRSAVWPEMKVELQIARLHTQILGRSYGDNSPSSQAFGLGLQLLANKDR